MRRLAQWASVHRWWLGLGCCILFGYQLGKDRALRDNRAAALELRGQ